MSSFLGPGHIATYCIVGLYKACMCYTIYIVYVTVHTYFTVIVDIIIISVIILTSATLLPWLYPFLYFVQVYVTLILYTLEK